MAPVDTLEIISQARNELAECVRSREQNDKRIAELRLLLRSLVRFMPDQGVRQQILDQVTDSRRKAPSITDSISQLLSKSIGPLTSNEIRDQLEATGFDLDEYSQPLATIQSTLQRLVDASKVWRDITPDKSVVYLWIADGRQPPKKQGGPPVPPRPRPTRM